MTKADPELPRAIAGRHWTVLRSAAVALHGVLAVVSPVGVALLLPEGGHIGVLELSGASALVGMVVGTRVVLSGKRMDAGFGIAIGIGVLAAGILLQGTRYGFFVGVPVFCMGTSICGLGYMYLGRRR